MVIPVTPNQADLRRGVPSSVLFVGGEGGIYSVLWSEHDVVLTLPTRVI